MSREESTDRLPQMKDIYTVYATVAFMLAVGAVVTYGYVDGWVPLVTMALTVFLVPFVIGLQFTMYRVEQMKKKRRKDRWKYRTPDWNDE